MIARRSRMLKITSAYAAALVVVIALAACTGTSTGEKLPFDADSVSGGEVCFLYDDVTQPVGSEGMAAIMDALLNAKLIKPPTDMDLPTSTHDIRFRVDETDYTLVLCEGETTIGLCIGLPKSSPAYWIKDDTLNQVVWDAVLEVEAHKTIEPQDAAHARTTPSAGPMSTT